MMSPQMKAILLSFKKLHFKPNSSRDVDGLNSLDEEEQDLNPDFSPTKESCQTLASYRGKVFFPRKSENQSEFCRLDKIDFTTGREKEENVRLGQAFSGQSKGAVRQRRRSWVVSKHILTRSNTVDSLQLQKTGDFCCSSISCKESCEVRGKEIQANSTPQTPSMAEVVTQYTLERRIKPKSASVVGSQPLSPTLNPRKISYRAKTGRFGIKPCSAVIISRRTAAKTDNMWEKLSEERKFLINKWLSPQDR